MGFQGFLDVSYAELVEKFGEPFVDYGSKVPYSWDININGVEGSVYGYYTTKGSKPSLSVSSGHCCTLIKLSHSRGCRYE